MILDLLFRRKKTDDPESLLARGDYESAIAAYRRTLAAEPHNASECHRRIGEAMALAGRPADAIDELLLAAGHFEDAGRILEAIPVYQSILAIEPGHRVVRDRIREMALEDEIALGEQTWVTGPATLTTHLRNRAPLLSLLTASEIGSLLPQLAVVRLGSGSTVYQAGEPADALYLVSVGEIALTKPSPSGNPIERGRVAPGGSCGRVSATPGDVRQSDAISSRATELLELHRDALEAVASEHPRVWSVVAAFQDSAAPEPAEAR